MNRRVAITGIGAISAAGLGAAALWDAARVGRSGIRPIILPRAHGNRVLIGGSVEGFDPAEHIDPSILRTCDAYARYALYAAAEAISAAGLSESELRSDRTAAIIGTGVGGIGSLDEGCSYYYQGQKFDTFAVPRVMASSAASHVSIVHGITGPTFAISSACASGSQSIGMAAMMIKAGLIDRAVVGGAEACLTPATMRAWEYLRVLSPDACRPFSLGRTGMVIGDGAAVVVLEAEDAVSSRGGTPLAWLAGYGTSSDARDMVQPDAKGAARAIRAALSDAGLPASEIGYINAHGTGTVLNDVAEAVALNDVFGAGLAAIPVSSSKPVIGHTLGAAGALELAITVAALREQLVPPHINCLEQDPKCELRLQLDSPLQHEFSAALSNSFAFGGINAALIVTRV